MGQVGHEVAQLVCQPQERSRLRDVGRLREGLDGLYFLWVRLDSNVADDVACELDFGADGKLLA